MRRTTLTAHRPTTTRAAAAVMTAGLLAALTACGAAQDATSTSGEVDVSHVHGLAVDPADPDRLYVATHEGLAAYTDDDGLQQVGDNRSDFMGFAVGPEGTLYASGHPGEGDDGPFALGLIASEDAGATWENVSLSGEADFHALDAHDDGVYGFDAASGLMRTSTDGADWTDVPTDVGFIDLAADPTSNRILGTTEQGLVASTNGGRSFQPVDGAPPLILVDFSPEGDLVGIDSQGRVRSVSPSGAWTTQSGLADNGLQALATGPDGVVWLLDGAGLRRSTDGGDSFDPAPAW